MTDLNNKLNKTQHMINEKQTLINNDNNNTDYYTVRIPEHVYHYQQLDGQQNLEFKKKIVIVRDSNTLKRNLYATAIILFIVFILCFAVLGIISFADTIKDSNLDNDDD